MKTGKKILLAILTVVSIYSIISMGTLSYFSDKEDADGTFTSGVWPDIDVIDAMLTGNGYNLLHNIWLIPGDSDMIDKISISWTDNNGEKVNDVDIGGYRFWTGISGSGDMLDGNYLLDKKQDNRYRFDSDMHEKTFTLQLILYDGQIIERTFIPKWRDEKPEGWNSHTTIVTSVTDTLTATDVP